MRRSVVAMATLVGLSAPALAQPHSPVVTRCTAPAGHGYFYPGVFVKSENAGWQSEKITNGQFLVMRDKEGAYDIVFTDATGMTISSRGDGGMVFVVNDSVENLVLIVSYPGKNIETWAFDLDARGSGTMTFSQARYGLATMTRKHSLMAASCSR